MASKKRCTWCGDNPLYVSYHDEEWGRPTYEDQELFEMLLLEGAQAGLSWITVLKKRENYRDLFDNFDAKKIAKYSDTKLNKLLLDPRIIRNRLKVYAFRKNAVAYLRLQKEHGSFSNFIWSFVDGRPINNKFTKNGQVPVSTEKSDAMSKALKKEGFSFVGSTICYAYMQASGMVNDHLKSCFCYKEINN